MMIAKKIKDSGNADANCLNLVFMAEGYMASEQSKFDADVTAKVAAFFADPEVAKDAYKFNCYSIFFASNQSGITNKTAITGQPQLFVDTYFKAAFWAENIQREVAPADNAQVIKELNSAIPAAVNKWNFLPILLCNTPYYGGAEVGSISTCTLHAQSNEVLLHELAGHTIAGVTDEYINGPRVESWNATQQLPVRWQSVYAGTPVTRGNWLVPTSTCKMNTLGVPFCIVCANRFHIAVNSYILGNNGIVPIAPTTPQPPTNQPDLTIYPQFTIPTKQAIPPSTIANSPNPDNWRIALNWPAIKGAPNYNAGYSHDGGSTWSYSMALQGANAQITHLISKANYIIKMRCDYGNGTYGAWSPIQKFTTL